MPRYEKVDDYTIRVIIEHPNDVTIDKLLQNKSQLLEQKRQIEQTLKNIDEILEEAKKMNITVKPKQTVLDKK